MKDIKGKGTLRGDYRGEHDLGTVTTQSADISGRFNGGTRIKEEGNPDKNGCPDGTH